MKSGQLFWGFLFVTIGALILFAKFDVLYFEWDFVWDLWPVLFILWGLLIISKKSALKPVLAVAFGITTGMVVYGFFANIVDYKSHDFDSDFNWNNNRETYQVDYNSNIEKVVLDMEVGAGTFVIRRTSHDLLNGYVRGDFTDYDFSSVFKDDIAYLRFDQQHKNFNIFEDKMDNRVELRLNDDPAWEMDIKIGAAKALFELDDFNIERFDLKAGATDINLKLGDKSERTDINIEMGAANLEIEIPRQAGCKISGDMVLVGKSFQGFTKTVNDIYLTENFDEADHKIYIKVDGGVANLEVRRY